MQTISDINTGCIQNHSTPRSVDHLVGISICDVKSMNAEYTRKRNAVACRVCRCRRTKCDGKRPKCSFCHNAGATCIYAASSNSTSVNTTLEKNISSILSKLGRIEEAVVKDEVESLDDVLQRAQPPPVDFPWMTLKTVSFITLTTGLAYNLSDEVIRLETLNQVPQQLSPKFMLIPRHGQVELIHFFFANTHKWFPLLDEWTYLTHCELVLQSPLSNSADSALLLMVLALGAHVSHTTFAVEQGTEYFYRAQSLLASVIADPGLIAVQCLILCSVYLGYMCRPLQSYQYLSTASMKLRTLMLCARSRVNSDLEEPERRAYWTLLILESEYCVQLDLVDTGIINADEQVRLPSFDDAQIENAYTPLGHDCTTEPDQFAYFLAEITMRRSLDRCRDPLTLSHKRKDTENRFAPIVARELETQLQKWHEHLPSSIAFDLGDLDTSVQNVFSLFLRAQYYVCFCTIFWPSLVQAIRKETSTNLEDVSTYKRFFESYIHFMSSISALLKHQTPLEWTLRASVFSVSVAALKARQSGKFDHVLPYGLDDTLRDAPPLIRRNEEPDLSLRFCSGILGKLIDQWQMSVNVMIT